MEDLFVISHWKYQFQGSQGPRKRPEIFLRLWNERRGVQAKGLEGPEVREGVEVGVQTVREELGKICRDMTSMLEQPAFTQGP